MPAFVGVFPDLAEEFELANQERRIVISRQVCWKAIAITDIDHAVVVEAISSIGERVDAEVRNILERLVASLDEAAWGYSDKVQNEEASLQMKDLYDRFFRQARAVSSVTFALEDTLKSGYNAFYEAYYAMKTHEEFVQSFSLIVPTRRSPRAG